MLRSGLVQPTGPANLAALGGCPPAFSKKTPDLPPQKELEPIRAWSNLHPCELKLRPKTTAGS